MSKTSIKEADRDAILQSLRAGVVPRRGQHLIQVGRMRELEVMIQDLDRIRGGSSAIRFVIGAFGSGKTFFLGLVRAVALQKKMVAVHADLSPDRRLYSTGGQARATYVEMMRNMSVRTKPDGGALTNVVEKFASTAVTEARAKNVDPAVVIRERLGSLSEMVGGYDFAHVIEAYWRGYDSGDDQLVSSAVRWLRAEFSNKTGARQALGVRTIIDDATVYDHLKLMARFVRLAGYSGLLVCLDELVNLYKLANGRSRNSNYEQILRILNDSLQGSAEGLGVLLGGTPEFLTDTRRGLFSYGALQSRLSENTFASDDLVDHSGPVLRLSNLEAEDVFVLLNKIRHVQAGGEEERHLVPDEAIKAFMDHCSDRVGDAYFRTPRNTIKEFVHLLAVLEQNPDVNWRELVGDLQVPEERNPDTEPLPEDAEEEPVADSEPGPAESRPEKSPKAPDDDELQSFRL